jgi:tRNA threonylcarbamoyladenosine biosynthesis protein TsaE
MIEVLSEATMQQFGEKIGRVLQGGEVLELVGDVGAGKTTMVRGIARGMGVDETVQSPSFTINRVYDAPNHLQLSHYDFYRLADPGIMRGELNEAVHDPQTVVVIEWADTVEQTLPADRLTITITSPSETTRQLELQAGGDSARRILEALA